MQYLVAFFGSSPGAFFERVLLAFIRALRTFVQGVLAALVSALAGKSIVDTSYGKAFEFAVVAAAVTALHRSCTTSRAFCQRSDADRAAGPVLT